MTDPTEEKAPVGKDNPEKPRRKWMPLAVVLVLAAGILGWEYRGFLSSGAGSLVLLLAVCLGMHFLMHRGHGGGGGSS